MLRTPPKSEYERALDDARKALQSVKRKYPLLGFGISIIEAYNASNAPQPTPQPRAPPVQQLPRVKRQLNPKPRKRSTKKVDYVDAEIIED